MNKIVLAMALLRIFSGSIEIIAAMIMLNLNRVDKALVVNSGLALVGPFVLIITMGLGLIGIADQISWTKCIWIISGIGLILYGVLK